MKRKYLLPIIVSAAVLLWIVFWLMTRCTHERCIASVDGRHVTRRSYEKSLAYKKQYLTYLKQDSKNYPTLSRDTQNYLIENAIVENYAEKQKIMVSDTEVTKYFHPLMVQKNQNENQYLTLITREYGMDKNAYLASVRVQLLRQKVQDMVKKPLQEWLAEQKKYVSITLY